MGCLVWDYCSSFTHFLWVVHMEPSFILHPSVVYPYFPVVKSFINRATPSIMNKVLQQASNYNCRYLLELLFHFWWEAHAQIQQTTRETERLKEGGTVFCILHTRLYGTTENGHCSSTVTARRNWILADGMKSRRALEPNCDHIALQEIETQPKGVKSNCYGC